MFGLFNFMFGGMLGGLIGYKLNEMFAIHEMAYVFGMIAGGFCWGPIVGKICKLTIIRKLYYFIIITAMGLFIGGLCIMGVEWIIYGTTFQVITEKSPYAWLCVAMGLFYASVNVYREGFWKYGLGDKDEELAKEREEWLRIHKGEWGM